MKRVLSLVLALVLVLGMIPTFAAEMTGADHLYKHEFIAGDGTGNLMTEQLLTREQLAKLVLELNGTKEEAEVLTLPPSYLDAAKISAWARPFVAYAQIEGLMKGYTDNTFRPQVGVSGQQLAQVLTRALGYEFPWATVVADAADLGIEVATGAALTRGDAFEAMWAAVNTMPKGETKLTLGQKLGKLDPPAPPVVMTAESVTAVNLKELVVKFNAPVDKTTAETPANYVITTTGTAATPVPKLAADGMTVNIVLTTKATQQEVIKLQVKDVKDAAGVKMTAKTFENITFFDATVPVAESIKLTGPTTFEVTFSEVMDTQAPTVLVNNGVYGASFDAWDGKVAKFNLSASLTEGKYTVKVSGARDAALYTALAKEFELNYVKDTTAPVASLDKATQLRVTFKFDEKVKNVTTANFYHTFSAWTPLAVYKADGTTTLLSTDFTDTVVVEFATSSTNGKPLVAGTNNVTVKVGAAGSEIKDLWGNKLAADVTFPVVVTADTTAPTVTKVEATDENVLKVTFDEDVLGATTAANYTVYDKDGKEVTTSKVATYSASTKIATLTFASDLAAGNYTVKVSNVTDNTIYANKIVASTHTFSISDLTAPTSVSAEYVVSGSNYFVYVTFPELMDTATTLVKANYQIGGQPLAAADTIELFGDASKVKITTANNPAGLKVAVKNVKDAAGNALGLFTTLESAAMSTSVAPTITSVKTKSLNTIEVVFNKHLSAAPAASFVVGTGDAGVPVAVAAATYVNNANGTSTVTMILHADENLANEGDTAITVAIINGDVKSFTGASTAFHASNDQAAVATKTDGVAPALIATAPIKTVDSNTDGFIDQVTIEYTEAIDNDSVSKFTYTVAGYTVVSATSGADTATVTLTLTPKTVTMDTGATPDVAQALAISDVAGNQLASVAAKAATDKVAPKIISAVLTDADADGNIETATVTFSEPMSDASIAAFLGGNGTFTIGGQNIVVANSSTGATANDAIYEFKTADGGAIGTGLVDLIFTAGADTLMPMDSASNKLANINAGAVTEVDAAAPVMLSVAQTAAATATVTMSEAVYHVALAWNVDWVGTVNTAATAMTAGSSAAVLVGAAAPTILITGVAPVNVTGETVTYDFTAAGVAKIFDVAGNAVVGHAPLTDANGF